jgi:magnesium transporter
MTKAETKRKKHKRWMRKAGSPPGAAPGALHVDPNAPQTTIDVACFKNGVFELMKNVTIEQLKPLVELGTPIWIDVIGLGSIGTLRAIGDLVHVHPLAMEDVLNIHQRAKVDQYGDSLFIIARAIDEMDACDSEQISFVLRANVLVSFQQRPGDSWEPVRNRLREGRGAVRHSGIDYLLYCLLDSIIDSYFPFIDHLADQLDKIDESITDTKGIAELEELHYFRRQLLSLRRVVRPHRDMINQLIRDEFDCISPETRIFLRDCFDHVIHVNDAAETYNELANGIRDYQMSIISNRMNEIMKVLTIMSSIFIPLSFVAGVYGMNFNTALPGNMPELNVPYGYVGALALMACMAGGMLSFFRYKRWI